MVCSWSVADAADHGCRASGAGGPVAHESPVDHVERQVELTIIEGKLRVRYRVELSERNALLQMNRMDVDQDGAISTTERGDFFQRMAAQLAAGLTITVDDTELSLAPEDEIQLDPRLGQTCFFSAPIELATQGQHPARLTDHGASHAPGPYRVVQPPTVQRGEATIQLEQPPQLVDLERHPGLIVLDFQIVVRPASGQGLPRLP